MKICLIAASLNILGGQAVQATEIVERFRKEGVVIHYLPINPKLSGLWGGCQKYKYLRTIVTSIAYIRSLIKEIPKYDVLHVFSASYFSFFLAPTPAVLIGRYYKKKVILNYHSGEAEDHLSRSEAAVKKILKNVDIVAVPSLFLKDVFSKFCIDTEVVYNVVNEKKFPYRERAPFKPRYIVSRNLEPMYNVACTLKSFRLIQDRYPDATLTILGYGSQEKDLKQLSKSLALRNVIFTGRVERDAIAKYDAQADFMLNASEIDNMPLSILEGFSSGIPVISTGAGGIPYMIEEGVNGLLIPLNDEKMMAEKAIYLLEHQDVARQIAENAWSDCRKNYSWEVNRKKWMHLYGMV